MTTDTVRALLQDLGYKSKVVRDAVSDLKVGMHRPEDPIYIETVSQALYDALGSECCELCAASATAPFPGVKAVKVKPPHKGPKESLEVCVHHGMETLAAGGEYA